MLLITTKVDRIVPIAQNIMDTYFYLLSSLISCGHEVIRI